jgi:hypothetical protein
VVSRHDLAEPHPSVAAMRRATAMVSSSSWPRLMTTSKSGLSCASRQRTVSAMTFPVSSRQGTMMLKDNPRGLVAF